jgi:hypothetical protein
MFMHNKFKDEALEKPREFESKKGRRFSITGVVAAGSCEGQGMV